MAKQKKIPELQRSEAKSDASDNNEHILEDKHSLSASKSKLAGLYRSAAAHQFSRLEHDPALTHQEKLAILYEILNGLTEVIGRLSQTAPERAPELWLERADRSEPVFDFIRRVYGPYIERGLRKVDLRRLDMPLYRAIFEWSRWNRGNPEVVLPSHRQANDRLIAQLEGSTLGDITNSLPPILRDRLKLYRTVSARKYQNKPKS